MAGKRKSDKLAGELQDMPESAGVSTGLRPSADGMDSKRQKMYQTALSDVVTQIESLSVDSGNNAAISPPQQHPHAHAIQEAVQQVQTGGHESVVSALRSDTYEAASPAHTDIT